MASFRLYTTCRRSGLVDAGFQFDRDQAGRDDECAARKKVKGEWLILQLDRQKGLFYYSFETQRPYGLDVSSAVMEHLSRLHGLGGCEYSAYMDLRFLSGYRTPADYVHCTARMRFCPGSCTEATAQQFLDLYELIENFIFDLIQPEKVIPMTPIVFGPSAYPAP